MALLDLLTKRGAEHAGPRAITKAAAGPQGVKAAYEIVPRGVQGRPAPPSTDVESLMAAHRRNELVYACINAKAKAATSPRLVVQNRAGRGQWREDPQHPARALVARPNPDMTEIDFIRWAIVSAEVAGVFYAEIVPAKGTRLPAELRPLNPAFVTPIPMPGGVIEYEYKIGREKVRLKAEQVIARRLPDLASRWAGLSPLAVAMGSVDADIAQTDFIRSFFNNGGVPSGLLKILNQSLTEEDSQQIKAQWAAKYGRASGRQHDVAVLDENAEYQKIGSGIDEIDSQSVRGLVESRICQVFGVPPQIVGAYVGLQHSTYSNYREAMTAFWDNELGPMFKDWAAFFTWQLLTRFEGDRVAAEAVRFAYDFAEVGALQEDVDAKHDRARKDFESGGMTLNEYRGIIGLKKDPQGDHYVRKLATQKVPFDEQPEPEQDPAAPPTNEPPAAPPEPEGDGNTPKRLEGPQKAAQQAPGALAQRPQGIKRTVDRYEPQIAKDAERYLVRNYKKAAEEIRKGIEAGQLSIDFGDEAAALFNRWHPILVEQAFVDGAAALGVELAFDLANDEVQAILVELATLVRKVADTTRDEIRGLVGRQAAEGWDLGRLADEIGQLAFDHAKTRAELIAVTETASAYSRGSMLYYSGAGVKRVTWLVTEPCPDCEKNQGAIVDLGADFPSGHPHPPAHPRCRCAIAPIV